MLWEEPEYYTISGPETIAAGESAVYTIEPLEEIFEAGNYDEEILIYNADNFDSYYFINALQTIEAAGEDFNINIKEDGEEIDEGGIVVEVGGEIELEADIDAITNAAPVLYSRLRSAPVAKAVPAGYSVSWEDIDGNVISTELKCSFGPFEKEGYYHYFLIVTGPEGNSTTVPITIYAGDKENDQRISISPGSYKFGSNRTKVAEFTIGNFNGKNAVELTNVGSLKEFKGEGASNFIFGGELFEKIARGEKVVLEPGESISFTVQPKAGLEPGTYAEMVGAGIGNGINYALAAVGYTEPEKLAITASDDITVFTGSNVKLSAKATGGSGKYTYEWVNTETGKVVSKKSSVLFGSSYTGKAGTADFVVTVTDGYGNTATEKVTVKVVEHSYDIAAEPGKLNFGTGLVKPEKLENKTVVITNNGNSAVTLKAAESEYFNISDSEGIVLEAGESFEIKVSPKAELAIGEYKETIVVSTEQGTKTEIEANYTVVERTYTIEVVPEKLDFGTDLAWFKTAKAQTVVITNKGNCAVTLKDVESEYFSVSDVAGIVLKPGESIEIKVKPNSKLEPGRYAERITVLTEEGTKDEFKAVYTVIAVSVKIEESEGTKVPVAPEKTEDEENPNTGAI